MDKLHILQVNSCPLFMIYSGGLEGDNPYAAKLLEFAQQVNLSGSHVLMDKGYDAFDTYAATYGLLGAIPIILPKNNAVVNIEGTEKEINKFLVKHWKEGGDIHQPIEKKLQFIYNMCQMEKKEPAFEQIGVIIEKCDLIVGSYFRNQYVINPETAREWMGKRSLCENRHAHMKTIVKLNVRGMRRTSKKLYIEMNFVVYQLLWLAHFQMGIQTNNFGNYN